ncbi:MAG: alpha/beta hydrolase [Actinomycetota bacterium]|nr:alpha/beta hydrolase [Actinomycetota bacterium]
MNHAVHRLPVEHRYGAARDQVADLWRPSGTPEARPVVVVIHGGFWRTRYGKGLMHGLCLALVRLDYCVWNIEYRRLGPRSGGGWPTTLEDVAAAIDALQGIEGVDCSKVVTCGHSAGGHLALWAAARDRLPPGMPGASPGVRVGAAVSLAGVSDLVAGATLGRGAAAELLGGEPGEVPERYAAASPFASLPLGVPQLLVHGDADTTVPCAQSERYVARAQALGDPARLLVVPRAGHFAVINPCSSAWQATLAAFPEL